MTILQLIHSDGYGGAESMLLSLHQQLRERDICCLVGLIGGGWLSDHLQTQSEDFISLKFKHTADYGLIREIREVISQRKVDLIHTHSTRMNFYGGVAAHLSQVPVVATFHGKDFQGRWKGLWQMAVTHCSDRLVAVSEDLSREMHRRKWPSRLIQVIPNGIEPGNSPTNLEREHARRELGIDLRSLVVGSAGRLEPIKNYSDLLLAMAPVMRKIPKCRLVLIGDGSLLEDLKNQAKSLGIANRTLFTGKRLDCRHLMAAMDLFVLCSKSEGLSISILEAMSAQTPIVATCVGGNAELVLPDVTGELVSPEDPKELSKTILALIQCPSLLQKMGKSARQHVLDHYTLDSMTDQYQSLYEKLLDDKHAQKTEKIR